MTFTFKFDEGGRQRRIVFEEKLDSDTGAPILVVVHVDGDFTADEMERARADALARWLHPTDPPQGLID